MMYLGAILEIRDHPTHPLKCEFDLGDGALEVGFLMVETSVWAAQRLRDLTPGVQVKIWDTGLDDLSARFRVDGIYPTAGLKLADITEAPARQGDAIEISGNPKLSAADAPVILAGIPPLKSLSHDLAGKIRVKK